MAQALIDLVAKRSVSLVYRNECTVFEQEEEGVRDDDADTVASL